MRLLLVGAFPYPHHQGSQVYFQEQARALRAAGAEVELMTYASSLTGREAPTSSEGFVHYTPPAWTAPQTLRSGPSWGKPLADLALAMTLRHHIASNRGPVSGQFYDAVLTHNAEACLVGLLALSGSSLPHVYCAHTLLGEELSTYAKRWKMKRNPNSWGRGHGLRRILDASGRSLDHQLARRVDGWIAMTHDAHRVMRQTSNRPGDLIAPAVPEPRLDPGRLDPEETAQRFGLEFESYFLYSGNLDGYQELEILADTARELGQAVEDPERRPRLVVASHDPKGEAQIARMPGVEFRLVPSVAEMLALIAAARATLLMREAQGGYPIKLANAHAAGTPVIAFREREWGLRDGENSLIASLDQPAASLARACLRLARDDDLAARLRIGARALYRAQHRPEQAAERTLALIERVIATRWHDSTRSRSRRR